MLQIVLSAVVDSRRPFVTATYKLEGDGPHALSCFEVNKELEASIHASYTPNLDVAIQKLCTLTRHSPTQLRAYATCSARVRRQISTTNKRMWVSSKLLDRFLHIVVNIIRQTGTCIYSLSVFPI